MFTLASLDMDVKGWGKGGGVVGGAGVGVMEGWNVEVE
jgi:hypothetical protein